MFSDPSAGDTLADAYQLLHLLWPRIRAARKEGRIAAFLQQAGSGEEFHMGDYTIKVLYGNTPPIPGLPMQIPMRKETAPMGGGFILQEEDDTFLMCRISANVLIEPAYGKTDQVFILDKRELKLADTGLCNGRILNGDERNYQVLGSSLTIQRLKFYHRNR